MEPLKVNTRTLPQTVPGTQLSHGASDLAVGSARHVPYEVLPAANNFPPQDVQRLGTDYVRERRNFIYSPRGAPSSVLSENALKSKSLGQKVFAHSEAATRYEFISNLRASEPRFRDQVDLLA